MINKSEATLTAIEKAMPNTKNTVQKALHLLEQTGIEAITRKQWLAIRKKAGLQIDPNTAEIMWVYKDMLSYDVGATGTPRREIYCRSAGTDEWVRFEDLPPDIRIDIAKKHRLSEKATQPSDL